MRMDVLPVVFRACDPGGYATSIACRSVWLLERQGLPVEKEGFALRVLRGVQY
jgi:hypothetical protein